MAKAAAKSRPQNHDDDWDVKATQSAIEAARAVISPEGINGRSMIASLSEIEWGWIVAAAIFAWIKTKAQQAVACGTGYEENIRFMAGRDPQPTEAGQIESILSDLSGIDGIDWSKPVAEWTKPQIIQFVWCAHRMMMQATDRHNDGMQDKIVQRISQTQSERLHSAASGGPLMSRDELNDDVPF